MRKGEITIKGIKGKVMTIANSFVKQGYSRSAAMVRAWITVKLCAIQTKAAGVTYGKPSEADRAADTLQHR